MEPQLLSPHTGPENVPYQPERRPISPEINTPTPESSAERHETRESQPGAPADPPLIPSPPPLPTISTHDQSGTAQQPADDTPATAADDDLIEKEWVEKAKRVIAETRHDPFLQEQAVSRLQADYLQKRYSKTVKLPGESA